MHDVKTEIRSADVIFDRNTWTGKITTISSLPCLLLYCFCRAIFPSEVELANLKALLVQSFSSQKMSQLGIEGNLRIAMAAKSHEFKMRVEHVLTKGSAAGNQDQLNN